MQKGLIIEDRYQETYLRRNFRGGPNTTEQCKYVFQASRSHLPKSSISLSIQKSSNHYGMVVHPPDSPSSQHRHTGHQYQVRICPSLRRHMESYQLLLLVLSMKIP